MSLGVGYFYCIVVKEVKIFFNLDNYYAYVIFHFPLIKNFKKLEERGNMKINIKNISIRSVSREK